MSNLPFEIQNLTPEEFETWEKFFPADCQLIKFGPEKYVVGTGFLNVAKDIQDFKLRDDDIFISGHPRSGTTMSKEMVWLLNNNMDFERSLSTMLDDRVPFFERQVQNVRTQYLDETEVINKNKPPRMFHSHLPISLLPTDLVSTAKVVYLARDPRDVIVSQFFLLKPLILKPECKLDNYLDLFLQEFHKIEEFVEPPDTLNCAAPNSCRSEHLPGLPLRRMGPASNGLTQSLKMNGVEFGWSFGPFFPHVKEAWELRNHSNLLFLFYEELRKDLPGVVRRVAKFLGKTYTDEQYSKLCQHLNIDNFKKNEKIRPVVLQGVNELTFVRKGKVGGWRDYFDEEMSAKADKWMAEQLRDTDLRFPSSD